MVSVAEQFGTLRQTLGSVLGIFTMMRWLRALTAKITGRPPPASSKELTPAKFAAFTGRMPDGSPAAPSPSKKPFFMFMIAVFGLPYLMGKLIKALARSQEEEERKRREANPQLYDGDAPIDPSQLEFCRVMYDFTPESNNQVVQGVDLAVKKGDLVAVLSKTDPMGAPSEWWRCRARDGRMGYLPSPYLEAIQRRQQAQITSGSQAGSPTGSRAQTMTNTVSAPNSRAGTMTGKVPVPAALPPKMEGKANDISVESFQKGGFYS
jgi:peroxin-13